MNDTVDTRNVATADIAVAIEDIPEPQRSVGQANVVYVNLPNFDVIFWILFVFVVLTILFLIVLIVCWCCIRFCPQR